MEPFPFGSGNFNQGVIDIYKEAFKKIAKTASHISKAMLSKFGDKNDAYDMPQIHDLTEERKEVEMLECDKS